MSTRTDLRTLWLSACCSLLICGVAEAQARSIRGAVYADANGNGRRDRGENGIPGVVVSNQADVVTTGPNGQFDVPAGSTGIVFVSVPDGYAVSSNFWRPTTGADTVSFALVPRPKPATFKFVHASDTHLDTNNVARFRRFRALVDSVHPDLVLMGGDLIRDAMSQTQATAESQFTLFRGELAPIAALTRTVPGNHDHYGIIRSRSHADSANPLYNRGMYRKYLGPDYYSFTIGGVHFVGMNSVQTDDSAYFGFIDPVQMRWLARDLETIPAAMPVVTFMHIPMVTGFHNLAGFTDMALVGDLAHVNGETVYRHSVANKLDVIQTFVGHQYPLALSSHMHASERLTFETEGMRLRFETSAAIVGGQDLGAMKIRSGFTVYTVTNGRIDAGTFVGMDPP
jgi:hypothetical protein